MTDKSEQIGALMRERAACEQRGLTDRVNEINKQLRALGAEGSPPRKRAETRPAPRRQETRA